MAFPLSQLDFSNTCLWLQAPDKPDEKLDGFSVSDVPRVEPNVVRMDVTGGFAMQKIGPDRMFFRLVCDLDMKLDFVPPWLINFIARQLVGHGHKLYQKVLFVLAYLQTGEPDRRHSGSFWIIRCAMIFN
jgi:hypothetical protein